MILFYPNLKPKSLNKIEAKRLWFYLTQFKTKMWFCWWEWTYGFFASWKSKKHHKIKHTPINLWDECDECYFRVKTMRAIRTHMVDLHETDDWKLNHFKLDRKDENFVTITEHWRHERFESENNWTKFASCTPIIYNRSSLQKIVIFTTQNFISLQNTHSRLKYKWEASQNW